MDLADKEQQRLLNESYEKEKQHRKDMKERDEDFKNKLNAE